MAQIVAEKKKDESVDNLGAATMKAVVCTAYGEPKDVLKLTDVPMALLCAG